MKIVKWIGEVVAWMATLTLFAGVFGISLLAIVAAVGGVSEASTSTTRYSPAPASPPVFEAEAFDVRKVAAFLADPRETHPEK